jgi:hypothetical protein
VALSATLAEDTDTKSLQVDVTTRNAYYLVYPNSCCQHERDAQKSRGLMWSGSDRARSRLLGGERRMLKMPEQALKFLYWDDARQRSTTASRERQAEQRIVFQQLAGEQPSAEAANCCDPPSYGRRR